MKVRPGSCDAWTALPTPRAPGCCPFPARGEGFPPRANYPQQTGQPSLPRQAPTGTLVVVPACEGGWGKAASEEALPEDASHGAETLPAASPVKRPAGRIPTAASCQPDWQTNPWKSKYVYHTDFLCPFLNMEGLDGFPESDLYCTEAMMISTRSRAHSSDYSHKWYRFAWFQDKKQKEPFCEGAVPPRSKH